MDELDYRQEPVEDTQQVRPVSPYADSPYEMQHQPRIKKKKKKGGAGKALLGILLVAVLMLVSNLITAGAVNKQWEEKTALLGETFNNKLDVLQQQISELPEENAQPGQVLLPAVTGGLTPSQIYEKNVRAVVAVSCEVLETDYYSSQTYQSLGSGFLFTSDGYVATNYHVVENAVEIIVTMYDDTEYEATLIGFDAETDVAVLKIEGSDFPCVVLGSSDALVVGDQVVAIGNALGEMVNTLTVGYISAKDKIINTDGTGTSMLQTDAAINSGNSGGPLFNTNGQVIGITTAKYSGNTASGTLIEGMGFAIPMDDILDILEDLRLYGYIKSGYLGIYCLDASVAEPEDLPDGVYVQSLMSGYCAEAAGIQPGDVITDLGGYKVRCVSDLKRVLRNFEGGDTTTVTVYRNGNELYLSVVLDAAPTQEQSVQQTPEKQWYEEYFEDYFG